MLKCQAGAVSKADYAIVALFICLATGFAAAALIQHRWTQETRRLAALGRYNARPEEVIGRAVHMRGPRRAPYVLVEFGDYECGPCRATEPRVKALLEKHEGNLALVFRDLPLTTIHSRAMDAAVLANRAADATDNWAIHDLLYSAKIDASSLRRATEALAQCTTLPLGEQAAMSRAHRFGAPATNRHGRRTSGRSTRSPGTTTTSSSEEDVGTSPPILLTTGRACRTASRWPPVTRPGTTTRVRVATTDGPRGGRHA